MTLLISMCRLLVCLHPMAQEFSTQPDDSIERRQLRRCMRTLDEAMGTHTCQTCKGRGWVSGHRMLSEGGWGGGAAGPLERWACVHCNGRGRIWGWQIGEQRMRRLSKQLRLEGGILQPWPSRNPLGSLKTPIRMKEALVVQNGLEAFADLIDAMQANTELLGSQKVLRDRCDELKDRASQLISEKRCDHVLSSLAHHLSGNHAACVGMAVRIRGQVKHITIINGTSITTIQSHMDSWVMQVPDGYHWIAGRKVDFIGRLTMPEVPGVDGKFVKWIAAADSMIQSFPVSFSTSFTSALACHS